MNKLISKGKNYLWKFSQYNFQNSESTRKKIND